MEGYICLHRKLLESTVFENEKMLKVWIWCLLKATWKERDQQVGMQTIHLFPGQFIFGRKVAAAELNMSESTVYRLINCLEKKTNLSVKVNNKFSVINVENWGLYQDKENVGEQQMNNRWTTDEQQMNTNNKVNKVNKVNKKDIEKKSYGEFEKVKLADEEYQKLVSNIGETKTKQYIDRVDGYLEGNKNKKYSNHYATIQNWYRKDFPEFSFTKNNTNKFDEAFKKSQNEEGYQL